MKTSPFYETHPVELTAEELAEHGREAARVASRLKAHKDKFDAVKREASATDKELTNRLWELGEVERSGKENREVECAERACLDGNIIETVRLDTREVVGKRAMTAKELADAKQGGLDFGGSGVPN